jgi:hypothetical protein
MKREDNRPVQIRATKLDGDRSLDFRGTEIQPNTHVRERIMGKGMVLRGYISLDFEFLEQ